MIIARTLRVDLDGDVHETTLGEFLADNLSTLPDIDALVALRVGETYHGGGGASPEWSVTRLT